MSKKPNVLFLMTDQHRHDGLGCANPAVYTPNLDGLAAKGVRFSNAVCNVPMCVPSRYSMMSGLYPGQIGVRHNTQMIPDDKNMPVPVLAQRFQEAGYQTIGMGKTHWYIGSRIMPDIDVKGSKRGFDIRYIARGRGNKNCEPDSIYMEDDRPEWIEAKTKEQKKAGPGGESEQGYIGETSKISPEEHWEGWLTSKTLDVIDTELDPERPFFLYVSLDYPHPGLHVPPGYETHYNVKDFKDNPPPEHIDDGHPDSEKLGRIWEKLTPGQRRRSRLRYYALCSYIDDCFGRIMDSLGKKVDMEHTIILFTSDHGDMLGDRGRVSKYCLYEGSIRVPLILAGPGTSQQGKVDTRHAELVDVMPTLLNAAGIEEPAYLPGIDLLGDITRKGSFAEMHGRGYQEYQQAPTVMYRTDTWKLILSLPGEVGSVSPDYEAVYGELYNLQQDPLELNNRYTDNGCFEIREDLTRSLLMHIATAHAKYPNNPARARINVTGPESRPDSSIWT